MRKPSIQYAQLEVDALSTPIREVVSRAWDHSKTLESAARAAFETIAETTAADRATELHERATWLRGAAAHALSVASELHFLAGRLHALADGRRLVEAALTENR